jgi:serine/threonine protein kinase
MLGFVHRDLKPENVVVNLGHPIKVALIDFNRSLPLTNIKQSGERGTPGY